MNWEAYEKKLIRKVNKSEYSFMLGGMLPDDTMPPLVKASSCLLKDAASSGAKRMVIVLPENEELPCTLILEKLLRDISDGTIKNEYDPSKFEVGEIVSIGNAIVKYQGTYYNAEKKQEFIRLEMRDKKGKMIVSAPLSMIPVMQKTSSNKSLSKYADFEAERTRVAPSLEDNGNPMDRIAMVKTHLAKSTVVVTYGRRVKSLITECIVNQTPLKDIVYIAQADLEGELKVLGTGKPSGIPGLLLTSELYSVSVVAEKEQPIESINLIAENMDYVTRQLDSLDELLERDIPITIFLDSLSSMELDELIKRDFFIWRWDNQWLSQDLLGPYETSYRRAADNLIDRTIDYVVIPDDSVSNAFSLISRNKALAETQTLVINSIFGKLFDLSFQTVRAITPFYEIDKEQIREELNGVLTSLENEKKELPQEEYQDLKEAISELKLVYKTGSTFPKILELEELFKQETYNAIYLVIPSSFNKDIIEAYWNSWLRDNCIKAKLYVCYFNDYYQFSPARDALTVVCGWYNGKRMPKILYSNRTANYVILLYQCETAWKGKKQEKWDWAIHQEDNVDICLNYLGIEVKDDRTQPIVPEDDSSEDIEDIDELEKYVSSIKYKKYVREATENDNDMVSVIPVFFSNNTFMFMRPGQELISITRMLREDWNDIEKKDSAAVQVGDYIVFRESGKDIIREVADLILEKSGNSDARMTSAKWKEALQLELLFSTEDEIFDKLVKLGWAKTKDTLLRWVSDDSLIAPQTKKDLDYLARATDNESTKEMIDQIYNASRIVKNAHINAGKYLSDRLKKELAHYIKKEAIDVDSYWDSMDIQIEDIGRATVLKITDIGECEKVNYTYVGRLLQE